MAPPLLRRTEYLLSEHRRYLKVVQLWFRRGCQLGKLFVWKPVGLPCRAVLGGLQVWPMRLQLAGELVNVHWTVSDEHAAFWIPGPRMHVMPAIIMQFSCVIYP